MSSPRETLRRLAVAALARHRGEVRALQDLRHLTEVFRLAAVFAVLMLLPTMFLAWQALSSVRSEELSLDADLQDRARAISTGLHRDLQDVFTRFEAKALERLRRGESPTDSLGELSPYLRASFRFDASGALAAPFDLPAPLQIPEPPAAWRDAARSARALERSDPAAAIDAWRALAAASARPELAAEAVLGEIRALAAGGELQAAEARTTRLFEFPPDLRERHGFRIYDVAVLKRIELRLARGAAPDASGNSSKSATNQILNVIGEQPRRGREMKPIYLGKNINTP